MSPSDSRPEPIEEILAALSEDGPAYTDDDLDAGYNAVLDELDHLTPQRARELDDLADEAELGSDAHALGLEYLDRGDLERAARWLRIAARHGVPGAEQQLQDACELHHAFDCLTPETAPQRLAAAEEPTSTGWGTVDLTRYASHLLEFGFRDFTREQILRDAHKEAERILADARRAAAQITASAQGTAHSSDTPLRAATNHIRRFPKLHTGPDCERMTLPLAWNASGSVEVRYMEEFGIPLMLWSRGECHDLPLQHLRSVWCDEEWLAFSQQVTQQRSQRQPCAGMHTLLNLVGREAAEAYEQAVEEGDSSSLRLYLAADAQLMPRLLTWARTAPSITAAAVHKALAGTMTSSSTGLMLPAALQEHSTTTA
ncbi:hypothetical protein [Streptomyces sp. NPDC093094]|uniref:hypothetical protein n=1 Tax=Streptomyces sp. NPDC093094 TaxID=3366026 RepID=UPI0038142C22